MPSPKFYRAPFQTQNPAALIDDNLFKFHPTEPTVGTQDQIHQKLLEFLLRHPVIFLPFKQKAGVHMHISNYNKDLLNRVSTRCSVPS